MADNLSVNAKIQIQVDKALRDLNKMVTELGNLESKSQSSSKELDRIQKSAVKVATAMEAMSKSVKDGTTSSAAQTRQLTAQQKAIQDLTRDYNSLAQAQGAKSGRGAVNQQFPLLQQQIKSSTAAQSKFEADMLASWDRQYKAQAAATKKTESDQLSSWGRQYQARDAFSRDQTRLSLAGVAREEQGRRATLSSLQQEITQRYKLRDSISAAQVAYANQANRVGASYGQDTRAIQAQTDGLAAQRYALYDVARTWALVSAATLGAAVSATMVAGSYESALSQVQRTSQTTGETFQQLSADLIQISQDMPVAFSDVAGIASLAGQLGVASESVASFSETVARFAATTDVTTQAAATGIGKLAQLTGTSATKYENLASAIYQTGITSVATESQILSTATQIATAGDLAGFTNTQIVALASSFASLGVAPERARGSIQRIFGLMTASAGEGGEKLEKLASVAGMTAAQFASSWKSEPQVAFSAFVKGLGQMGKAGEDTNAMLKDMGIGAVRDIQALQALGNNFGVYAQALEETESAYASGTAVIDGYALVVDDLLSTLTRLKNTVMAVMASIGENSAVKAAANFLLKMAGAAEAFVQTGVGGFIAKFMLGLTALVGVFAAVQGGLALTRAAGLGMIQVAGRMTTETGRNAVSLRTVASALVTVTGNTGRAAAATTAYTNAVNTNTGALVRTRAAAAGMGAALRPASGYAAAFGSALKFGLWGAGFVALTAGITAVVQSMRSAEEKARDLFGGASGLAEALKEDTAAFNALTAKQKETTKEFTTFVSKVEKTDKELNAFGKTIESAAGSQVGLNDNTATTTKSVEDQTIAVGKLTKEWAINALTTGEVGDKMVETLTKYGAELEKVEGFDLGKLITMSLDPNQDVGAEIDKMLAKLDVLEDARDKAVGGYYGDSGRGGDAVIAGLIRQREALSVLEEAFGGLSTNIEATGTRMTIAKAVAVAYGVDLEAVEEGGYGAADGIDSTSDAVDKLIASMFGSLGGLASVEDAMFSLGEAVATNGTSFDYLSENGRANMSSLESAVKAMAESAGSDTGLLVENLSIMLANLENAGVATTDELGFVQDQLWSLVSEDYGLDLDTTNARQSIQLFLAEAIKAAEARAVLERQAISDSAARAQKARLTMAMARSRGAKIPLSATQYKAPNTDALDGVNDQIDALKALQAQVVETQNTTTKSNKSFGDGYKKGQTAVEKANKAIRDTGDAAKEAAEEIKSLVDYASELGGVFQRAFDLRYGVQQGQDDIAAQYEKIQKTAEDAAQAIADANQKIREIDASLGTLRTSNKTLEYQLSVAIEYGDTLRAEEIRAKMGENSASISGLESDRATTVQAEADAQDAATKSLTANTVGGRANREMVLSLVQSYQKQIQTLASSGLSADELARKTALLEEEFRSQLTQMGYNRAEVDRYTQSFRDMSWVIANIPRNVTVTANTNPAQQAINEFMAANANKTINANVSASGGDLNLGSRDVSARNLALSGDVNANSLNARQLLTAALVFQKARDKMFEFAGFSSGGYTGRGGKNEEAGIVHKGEYVVPKEGVDQNTGLPYQSYMSNMLPSSSATSVVNNYASGSAANAIQLVELLPTQLSQLMDSLSVNVGIDATTLAGAVNGKNQQASTRSNA